MKVFQYGDASQLTITFYFLWKDYKLDSLVPFQAQNIIGEQKNTYSFHKSEV